MFDANRRRYPRANFPCQLTIWLDNEDGETILTNAVNVGIGGLCVYLNKEIFVGTKLDIEMNFNDVTTPLRCKGTVVRCILQDNKSFNVGIEFEPLSDLKLAFIDQKVSELISLEKKEKS